MVSLGYNINKLRTSVKACTVCELIQNKLPLIKQQQERNCLITSNGTTIS